MSLRVEFTVEPFVPGAPGPHVLAAVDAAAAHGLTVEFGPFGSSGEGAALEAGASRVSVQVSRID